MFQPIKRYLPRFVWQPLRSLGTALLTPVSFSVKSGHFRSSFANLAVAADGAPLPWYTYPAIDFLSRRDLAGRSVLEFGGGQSTLWWAGRAASVTTIEEDAGWAQRLQRRLPANVTLKHVPIDAFDDIGPLLGDARYDVIVVDGHRRREATALAFHHLTDEGALILDNANGYGFFEETMSRDCQRIDFWGHAPGVILPHCTSLIFGKRCFLLSPDTPIA